MSPSNEISDGRLPAAAHAAEMWVVAAPRAEDCLISVSDDDEQDAHAAFARLDESIEAYEHAVDAYWSALPNALRQLRRSAPNVSQNPAMQVLAVDRIRWHGLYFDIDSENVVIFRTGQTSLLDLFMSRRLFSDDTVGRSAYESLVRSYASIAESLAQGIRMRRQ